MTRHDLTRAEIGRLASAADLAVVGITDAAPFYEVEQFLSDHIAKGHVQGMDWFTPERAAQSCDPSVLHATARSIISVAVPFWTGVATPPDDGVLRGRIARYAWGRDYHTVLKRRMRVLVAAIEQSLGRTVEARTLVDTARIVDRAVAARSGSGWYGKNSMIIVPNHGSWVMLGEVILDVDLPTDLPIAKNCGRCTICLDRCPTGAIVEPYRIDAPRCISYLTIEERGPIPHELRPLIGDYVFGCDTCQDVCPYTGAARQVDDPDFAPRSVQNSFPSLSLLATMDEAEFRITFSGTPVTRAKRRGMARNAAVALGNSHDQQAEPILVNMLQSHDEPLARGHAASALWTLVGDTARRPLEYAALTEQDAYVLSEIAFALSRDSN